MNPIISTSIIGLVVEFVVAIDEARVRFTDDAQQFLFCFLFYIGSLVAMVYLFSFVDRLRCMAILAQ